MTALRWVAWFLAGLSAGGWAAALDGRQLMSEWDDLRRLADAAAAVDWRSTSALLDHLLPEEAAYIAAADPEPER